MPAETALSRAHIPGTVQIPASLAARLLYHAALHGNISSMRVGDLGCGTGIRSIWAALLEAREYVLD